MAERAQVSVTGVVQGVGFRPYVYSLANLLGLFGYVSNTAGGVQIDIEGDSVPEFLRRLPAEAPPLARITDIAVTPLPPRGYTNFSIHESSELSADRPFTLISSDVSVCRDCLRELNDPQDRRYRYPFINCTNCGPRYTITRAVPYDRPNTTMSGFTLCPACSKEYHDPADRRFHAQPIACAECGPTVELRVRGAECGVKGTKALESCVEMLQEGGIVAIKGLGGLHIACDAMNHAAVTALRERKRRSNKPFAVMAATTEVIRSFCEVTPEEQELLESSKRPIVLLRKKQGREIEQPLSDAVAPNNQYIGCMLPYTPLHALLFSPSGVEHEAGRGVLKALVMTSGNLSEEPIVHRNDEAIRKLSGLADAFLLHDRDIFMRVDDSVVRVRSAECGVRSGTAETAQSEIHNSQTFVSFIRRSRGYAPEAIALPDAGPEVLGCGADLKNTFTLTKGSFAIPSQHIGDMENYETLKFFEETLANLKQVFRVDPVAIVHDLHPGYLSTRWALDQSTIRNPQSAIVLYGIQHHYAHIGSVMAEHGLTDKVIGVAFDGTGYGTDGNLWGGEFLIAGIEGFERAGQIKYIPLPGGESAIREPWRTAISYIADATGEDAAQMLSATGFIDRYGQTTVEQVLKIAKATDLSPRSSGAGRLFDAVSALLGVCDVNTFEGEAAMALEALTEEGIEAEYPVVITQENEYTVLDFALALKAIVADLLRSEPRSIISTRFHNTVAAGITMMVRAIHQRTGITDVALSGGTFQNLYLFRRTAARLAADGMRVHANVHLPPNDACISLGQAYLVRERLKKCGVRNAGCGR
ncbi:MAG: carbamoyltransferase HypF [Nitrospirota bacterium]